MIEKLASKNDPPTEGGPWTKFPESYDMDAQVTVYLAILQLLHEENAGIDELLLHTDDKRYSYSYEAPSGVFHHTVGGVCNAIAKRSILCFDTRNIILISADQRHVFPWRDTTLQEWWKQNRHRPLWELQIEAIDLQIVYFENASPISAAPIHPLANRLPAEKFDLRRKKNIETLRRLRDGITVLREPLVASSLDEYLGAMTRLPWPTRNFGR